ncbi:hypothetical protein EG329_008539 [Mollisiaceae sp. DMI_Dod_QoI]|nr:hypothetical protein EG329_008539 [Helotiales sp. DMI_Dod_QoI]
MASWKDIENMVAERGVDDEVFFKVCYLVIGEDPPFPNDVSSLDKDLLKDFVTIDIERIQSVLEKDRETRDTPSASIECCLRQHWYNYRQADLSKYGVPSPVDVYLNRLDPIIDGLHKFHIKLEPSEEMRNTFYRPNYSLDELKDKLEVMLGNTWEDCRTQDIVDAAGYDHPMHMRRISTSRQILAGEERDRLSSREQRDALVNNQANENNALEQGRQRNVKREMEEDNEDHLSRQRIKQEPTA